MNKRQYDKEKESERERRGERDFVSKIKGEGKKERESAANNFSHIAEYSNKKARLSDEK